MGRVIVYDLEIERCVPPANGRREDGVAYCEGWHDHAGMGISVVCAFDLSERRTRVFCRDNLPAFQDLLSGADLRVGFNNLGFDDKVLAANGISVPPEEKAFDLLREMWLAAGLGPEFDPATHGGFGLDRTALVNLGHGKTGHGELAPAQWQRGEVGAVIDYCIADVWLTTRLFRRVLWRGCLRDPRAGQTSRVLAGRSLVFDVARVNEMRRVCGSLGLIAAEDESVLPAWAD